MTIFLLIIPFVEITKMVIVHLWINKSGVIPEVSMKLIRILIIFLLTVINDNFYFNLKTTITEIKQKNKYRMQ
jgi:hypothetical protein